MDIYTAFEEAYKRGIQDAVDKIAPAIAKEMRCLTCPLDCEYAEGNQCEETIKLWLKDLVEE